MTNTTMKCNETSTEDNYDLSGRSNKFDNSTWVYYILLCLAMVAFYVFYGILMNPFTNTSKNKIPQVNKKNI